MKRTIILALLMIPFIGFAQDKKENDPTDGEPFVKRTTVEAGISLSTNGDMFAVALNGMQYWGFGNHNRKFKIGLGARMTSGFGNGDLEYTTALASLAENESTTDTVFFEGTQTNSLNAFLALRYDITERWGVEANIDLAGFSFGGEKTGVLDYDGKTLDINGTPTSGNLLLIGNNDLGNLNSEFLLTYRYKSNWRFKAGAMFLFNEYTLGVVPEAYTEASSDELLEKGINRFRSKNLTFGLGVNYVF